MIEKSPIVSVIIPTYNGSKSISATIESVLNQTFKDFEIIVVDDGSTDDTTVVLKQYKNRIHYFRKSNGGPASARNLGLRNARGKYIAFLDHDDIWLPSKLTIQTECMENHSDVGLVYSDIYEEVEGKRSLSYYDNRIPRSGYVFKALFRENFIANVSALIRRECFTRLGLLNESRNMITTDDYHMWLRLSLHYPIRYINQPLAIFRIHGHNLSSNVEVLVTNTLSCLEHICQQFPEETNQLGKLKRRRFSQLHYQLGKHYADRMRIRDSLKEISASIREDPTYLRCYVGMAYTYFLLMLKFRSRKSSD